MKINLFQNYYLDKDTYRQVELDFVRTHNRERAGFDKRIIIEGSRPTFNEVFKMTKKFPDDINVIGNADIYFPENTVEQIKNFYSSLSQLPTYLRCVIMALSRWDVKADGSTELFNRPDSQDVWIKLGEWPHIPGADFFVGGVAGCDNKIAYLLDLAGFRLINPSKDIACLHLHLSEIRNYIDGNGNVKERIGPPYKLIAPTHIHQNEGYAL